MKANRRVGLGGAKLYAPGSALAAGTRSYAIEIQKTSVLLDELKKISAALIKVRILLNPRKCLSSR
jgi:hypothetical protein